ncbi:hypothetical protein [Mycolicibacterium chubuense]|uniref:hypothetical protein n=1 Tax=Mycolicibacterium chubuense TaxID=1800 RepID=UPI001EF0E491|nr:hypothetical protein [Mycolicibacterium chubuense]
MAAVGCLLHSAVGVASAATLYSSGSPGVDVSWPNCTAQIPADATFGIIGVTERTVYSTTNPCLAAQAAHFPNTASLYANSGWNDHSVHLNAASPHACLPGDANCLAYNYGYNAGLAAYDAASAAGVVSTTWWLDVESDNTWNDDAIQNRSSLQGEHDALTDRGATTVGVYSTTAEWQAITNDWQNNWPSWIGAHDASSAQGRQACIGHQFTGGPTLLVQTDERDVDRDIAC